MKRDRGPTGRTFEIRTLDDFKLVPSRRLTACLREFRQVILVERAMEELVNAVGASQPDWPADGVPMKTIVFRWVDDGVRALDVAIKPLASDTDAEHAA